MVACINSLAWLRPDPRQPDAGVSEEGGGL